MEIWKKINQLNYMVSNYGNVMSIKSGANIKQQKQNNGYFIVHLCSEGKRYAFTVHRLVAIYHIENTNNYPVVNHIDGNKENNNVENLEWCTLKQNSQHAVKNGLFKSYTRTAEQKENTRQWMIKATRGVPKSKEHCERMSRDRKGITPKCMIERNRKDFIKVQCVESGEIFPTMKDAGASIGLSRDKMRRHILYGSNYPQIKNKYIRI